jgi:predicted O-methyltransferase YrrM
LAEFFHELGYTTGVEVGTRVGDYSKLLCQKIPGLALTCVDPWEAYSGLTQERQEANYQEAVKRLTPLGVRILRMPSMEALKEFPDRSLDFAYIDGNHQFDHACMDIICWAKKIKQGGIMAVHDYCNFHWNGVMKAVDAYTHCHHIDPWYVTREREPTAFWENP